jgi:hypothetical protein
MKIFPSFFAFFAALRARLFHAKTRRSQRKAKDIHILNSATVFQVCFNLFQCVSAMFSKLNQMRSTCFTFVSPVSRKHRCPVQKRNTLGVPTLVGSYMDFFVCR